MCCKSFDHNKNLMESSSSIVPTSAAAAAAAAAVDLQPREAMLRTVDVADALVHEESLLAQWWAMVQNKLHLLKGNMMPISGSGGCVSDNNDQ